MNQPVKNAFADIELPLAIFDYALNVYHGLLEKYPDHVQPFSKELYQEIHGALNLVLAPHAYHLCAFAAEIARAYPELVGLPKPKAPV